MKKNVLVSAPVLSQSGYGEHARLVVRSLRAYEEYFNIFIANLSWGQTSWLFEDSEERRWIDDRIQALIVHQQNKGPMDISVQVTIPNEWKKMCPINIGVTAGIEVDRVSPVWIEKAMLMDKIIVVSNHAKHGFTDTSYSAIDNQTGEKIDNFRCPIPIHVIPYPIKKYEKTKVDLELTHDFNFLVVAQWGPRKNIENTIAWFMEEFKDKEVGLILKVSSKNNSIIDREYTEQRLEAILSHYQDSKCSVHLVHGYMTEQEMHTLYSDERIKSLISISRGEGYGLPIFEAAYSGLPIITTSYSGQTDFLYAPAGNGAKKQMKKHFADVEFSMGKVQPESIWKGVIEADANWCSPDRISYRKRLREMVSDYPRFKQQAMRLKKHLLNSELFSESEIYRQYSQLISGENLIKIDAEMLPRVSLYASVYDAEPHIDSYLTNMEEQTIWDKKIQLCLVHPKTSPGFDKEHKAISEFVKKYPENVKYQILEEDPGTYACWNLAIDMCDGEFVGNRNMDDRMAKYSTEIMAKELFLAGEDIGLVYCDSLITNEYNETFEKNSSEGRKYNLPEFSPKAQLMVNLPHAQPLYRKSLHESWGKFDASFKSAADWEYWLKCVSRGVKFKKIGQVLNLYCFNPTGISTNPENFSWKRKEEEIVFNRWKDAIQKMEQ